MEVETATHRLSEVMRKDPAFSHLPAWFEYISALSASLLVDATGSLFRTSDKKLVPLQTLEYLVSSLTVFKNTSPHDTIYSLLSIAKDVIPTSVNSAVDGPTSVRTYSENAMEYQIDYSLSLDDMCVDFVRFATFQCTNTDPSRTLDIICRPWAPKLRTTGSSDSRPLPSWVASISDAAFETFEHVNGEYRIGRKNADSLVGLPAPSPRNYAAAGTSSVAECDARYVEVNGFHSLYVRGFILDTVETVSVASQNGNIAEEWLETAGWTDIESEVPEAFWRTLVADRGSHGRNPPAYYRRVCQTYLAKGLGSGSLNTTELIHEGRSSGTYFKPEMMTMKLTS